MCQSRVPLRTTGGQAVSYHSGRFMQKRLIVYFLLSLAALAQERDQRPRAPEIGIPAGTLPRGVLDAITDVAGVRVGHSTLVRGDDVRLFVAVIEATEEAIYNSLLQAAATTGSGHTVQALPIDRTVEILRKYGAVPR
jgi:hypothetical protein